MRYKKVLITATIALAVLGGLTPSVSAQSGGSSGHHIVRSGDTVPSIARRYGVSADALRSANGIVDDKLYAGARLQLPAKSSSGSSSSSSSSSSSGSSGGTYTVRKNDALERIARRHGVSLSSLLSANGLKRTSVIMPGDKLTIPGSGGSSSSSASSSRSGSGGTYTVRKNDALERIARRHGVSLSSLLSANGLKRTSVIMPGDKLTIPGSGGSSSTSGSSSSGSSGSSASSVAKGPAMVCPVPGASFMNDWGFPRGSTRYHEGTDLFASRGVTVVAPVSGSIRFGRNALGGRTFRITTPDGWEVYGAHLDTTTGADGQVSAGAPVGTVGDSGNAKGGDPHLHLSLRPSGGKRVNPYPSLRAAC